MIYVWKKDGKDLVLDLKELSKYKELIIIYERDTSKHKEAAKRIYKFIDLCSNRDSYCVLNGLTDIEAHAFARNNCNMPPNFVIDDVILKAIKKAKELNGGVIEDLIDIAVSALHSDASMLSKLKCFIDDLQITAKDVESVKEALTLTKHLIEATTSIPKKVKELTALRKEYSESLTKGNKLRGGNIIQDSHEGNGSIEKFTDTGEIEHL